MCDGGDVVFLDVMDPKAAPLAEVGLDACKICLEVPSHIEDWVVLLEGNLYPPDRYTWSYIKSTSPPLLRFIQNLPKINMVSSSFFQKMEQLKHWS